MTPLPFDSPLWSRAFTLAERHALLGDLLPLGSQGSDFPNADHLARARRRLERWQAQWPFSDDSYFAQRLALDGVSQERLLAILSTPIDTLHKRLRSAPPWLAQLEEDFTSGDDLPVDESPLDDEAFDDVEVDETFDDAEGGEAEDNEQVLDFLELIRPLIDRACDQLRAGLAEIEANSGRSGPLPFDPATIEDILLSNLLEPLLMRWSRTLVLELHVARLQGHLAGDTPQERFESFIERIRQPEIAVELLSEYPVLARQLLICINQWVEVSLEFMERLCCDWPLIQEHFAMGEAPGRLDEVAGGAGDTHRGGRSVMIAIFESGFRIVYKPKSLKIDQHFQELLLWVNDKGCHPPLQTMKVLDRGEYGWVEFVQYQTCETRAELERFFQRHGAYLALLYALNSNDFHYENLIAAGEHPLLIDLETLLQPSFDIFDETQAEFAAEKVMAESVLQVGLLPMRMWSSEDYIGIDISGLGGMTGQLSPDRLPQLTDVGTDAMRYIRQRVEIAGVDNRPSLKGAEVSPNEYVEEIITGFTAMYHLLVAHRDELLAPDGPLERFAYDEIRVLLRPTRTYDQLLSESFHPDLLHDALDRQQFLDRLWVAATVRPYLAQVIASEQADLQRGDIPIFTSHPNSLELFGHFEKGIGGVLYETGMSAVRRRIARLSDQDMNRQQWFIRASIATLETSDATPPGLPVPPDTDFFQGEREKPDRERLLASVQAIADHLASTAIYGVEDVTWMGMELLNQQTWVLRQISVNLSNGLCGVALFLAYAGAITGNESHTLLARRAWKTIQGQIESLQDEMAQIGAFEGWGGILYTMTHLSTLWNDESMAAQATELAEIVANLVTQDEQFNIAQGCAGALIALLHLYRTKADTKALEIAILCGDHLSDKAKSTEQGVGWDSLLPGQSENELLYGSMGIAWALLELAAVTGDERYALAATASLSDHAKQGTSTVQNPPEPESPLTVGRGLAWFNLLRHVDVPMLHAQLQRMLTSLPIDEIGQSRPLTHGDIGFLELLLLAGEARGDDHDSTAIDQLAALMLESAERQSWLCNSPGSIEVPGLITGLSGLGYALLRCAEPLQVPSVLAFAPPPSKVPQLS